MGDCIGEYCGILGVQTTAHIGTPKKGNATRGIRDKL